MKHPRRTFLATAATIAAAPVVQAAQSGQSAPKRPPLTIERQGSFYYGYRLIDAPGAYDPTQAVSENSGDTFSVDQGYVHFQIPHDARDNALVMVHGGGQTGKTYEDLRDRDGFQSLFLRRGWSVYIPDFVNRGKAGLTSFTGPLGKLGDTQMVQPPITIRYGLKTAFNLFRLGYWTDQPRFYDGVAFPQTQAALAQLAAGTIATVRDNHAHVSANLSVLVTEIGPTILFTHSQSGLFGWLAAIKNDKVKAVITFETGGFAFPKGEVPVYKPQPGGKGIAQWVLPDAGLEVSLEEFKRLTRIPILVVLGDNIPRTLDAPAANPWQEFWRQYPEWARHFAAAIKRHGGDVEVLHLPDVGVRGNTHWAFMELNNDAIAEQYSKWMERKGLDRRSPRPA